MTAHNSEPSPGTKRPAFVVRAARSLWRLVVDPSYRNLMRLRLLPPTGAFQPVNNTRADRYPKIFGFVQSTLGATKKTRILSYGCSTGEEAFSLRGYFPHAVIKGIDINAANIAVCRRRLKENPDAAMSFETASSTEAEPAAAYDAIFAMAVLRHGNLGLPGVARCDHLIRFDEFARVVEDFRRCLKPDGLLVIRHSNFRLIDAPAGVAFETILCVENAKRTNKVPIFGPDNLLMAGVEYPDTVFRKVAHEPSKNPAI
jgi:SAM-dependent methyltransferase